MLHFDNDYMEGAHPLILERLLKTNMEKTPGYGTDNYCEEARLKIRKACGCPEAEIHFLVGGTQTNATLITALLRPYEGVLSAKTGHISIHEAGAIEAGGHKVLPLPHYQGKIKADDIENYIRTYYADGNHEHMVAPGMVYISHPTEYGTLYTRAELEQISRVCHMFHIPLYLDGARLGYGLASSYTDVTLQTVATTCDIFYIGGTKVGALFGEAVVIPRPDLIPHLFSIIKQRGALLAKGRLLGLQFDTLFTDNLYMDISRHAIHMSRILVQGLKDKGYIFHMPPQTNQLFIILDNERLNRLSSKIGFEIWEKIDKTHTAVRIVTSWATREECVDELIKML